MADSPPTPPAEDLREALVRLGRLAEALAAELAAEREARRAAEAELAARDEELAAEREARRLLELRVAELERRLGRDSLLTELR